MSYPKTTDHVIASVNTISTVSHEMHNIIALAANQSKIQAAILSHYVFKTRIYAMTGHEPFEEKMIGLVEDHKGSRIGKWYYSKAATAHFSRLKAWPEVEKMMVELHKTAADALRAKHEHKNEHTVLDRLHDMEDRSKRLMGALLELNNQVKELDASELIDQSDADAELF